jgi:hypothetical protein
LPQTPAPIRCAAPFLPDITLATARHVPTRR